MVESREAQKGSVVGRADARRQKIIAAARTLFCENGFHATGVAQIATKSGVAVGQIYRDFASKEAIVAAIVETDSAVFLAHDSLRQAIDAADFDLIWRWIRDFLEGGRRAGQDVLLAEILAESTRNERIAAIFETTRQKVQSAVLAALEALAPGEHLRARCSVLAEVLLATSLGLVQHRLLGGKADQALLAEMAVQMLRRELAVIQSAP